jgi:outer membrane protein TolC
MLLCTMPWVSQAEETLSLKDSVSFALEHNRMLSAAQAQVQATEAQADAATGQLMPRLDLSTGYFAPIRRLTASVPSYSSKV